LNKADQKFCDFLPLICSIDELTQTRTRVTVAIDGNSAAGKSSLAARLQSIYSCNVFSMDDFFLRPFQRTPERLGQPGGNVDYERFGKEIIEPLRSGMPFVYRPYDCRTQKLSEPVAVTPRPLNIIEGVYSLHPHLTGAYDIKVFLALDEAEQRRRLSERNAKLYNRFMREWVPMESRYFEFFDISAQCDFIFRTSGGNA